jgi:hypothetical protein
LLYLYRTDIWNGVISRVIQDVDSYFYVYKEKTLDFIMGLMEGEGEAEGEIEDPYKVTKFMSNNFSAVKVFKLFCQLLKRLAISSKFKRDPSWKKSILK